MSTKPQHLIVGIVLLLMSGVAMNQQPQARYIRLAELEIDPAYAEAFAAATREVGQASVQSEAGCIVLYAVAEKDRPAFVRVFEVYRDRIAYEQHLQSPHFRKFRNTTDSMVKSRRLLDMTAVSLATKPAVTP